MNKPIHTPGPLYVSIVEHETPVLQSAALEEDNFICEVEGRVKGEAKVNARLLAAAYNAFDSAGKKLGINAVELSERMQNGEIAELLEIARALVTLAYENPPALGSAGHRIREFIAKVKGGAT